MSFRDESEGVVESEIKVYIYWMGKSFLFERQSPSDEEHEISRFKYVSNSSQAMTPVSPHHHPLPSYVSFNLYSQNSLFAVLTLFLLFLFSLVDGKFFSL